ncbi:MAG: hypothetical protein CBC49_005680 [Alphaproteobacteria bacterium TMED89]|nr:hypothetical protein [Rhodospirillaceae bacterium]RPH15216.1 MAG: hypothetical protein CBC49_005680 [Alphaproteobacteria bacterium TMED89]
MKRALELTDPIDWPNDGWIGSFEIREDDAEVVRERLELTRTPDDLHLTADYSLTGKAKELVIKLNLTGSVTQTCVVTLEPIHTNVQESFIRRFREGAFIDQTEIDIDVADGDISTFSEDLEPWVRIADERPSLLDFVVEQLGLILDAFPRKEGAEVAESLLIDPLDRPEKMSPFAALSALKKD